MKVEMEEISVVSNATEWNRIRNEEIYTQLTDENAYSCQINFEKTDCELDIEIKRCTEILNQPCDLPDRSKSLFFTNIQEMLPATVGSNFKVSAEKLQNQPPAVKNSGFISNEIDNCSYLEVKDKKLRGRDGDSEENGLLNESYRNKKIKLENEGNHFDANLTNSKISQSINDIVCLTKDVIDSSNSNVAYKEICNINSINFEVPMLKTGNELNLNKDLMLSANKNIGSIDTSNWESESTGKYRRPSSSGDTLILRYEESDLDSEVEKCNDLLNHNKSELLIKNCSFISMDDNFDNPTNNREPKSYEFFFGDNLDNAPKINTDFDLKQEENNNIDYQKIRLTSDYLNSLPTNKFNFEYTSFSDNDSVLVINEDGDIDSEFEKGNELISDSNSNLNDFKSNIENVVKNEEVLNEEGKLDVKSNLSPEINSHELNEIPEDFSVHPIKIEINSNANDIKESQSVIKPNPKVSPERIFKLAIGSLDSIISSNSDTNSHSTHRRSKSHERHSSHSNRQVSVDHDKDLKKDTKRKARVPEKDYLEDEKEDIINPEWNEVKNLSTNEERYKQVRNCWKSRTVPDPNKNLTYHSYRKRLFQSGPSEVRPIRQHKRQASTNLNESDAKRLCTFFLDKEIDSIKRTKDREKEAIINEMHDKISSVDEECYQRQNSLHNRYNSYRNDYHDRVNEQLNYRISTIADEYNKMVDTKDNQFENKIFKLNERREEMLKFYSFYKGLNSSKDDPTLLTESQFKELDEIENIYQQFNHYYK